MAVQFAGLVAEHQAVRSGCGLFDISHMGVLRLRGDGAKDALQALVPTDLFRIGPAEACYTVLLNEAGGILDDLIVYDQGRVADETVTGIETDGLLLVINAACAEADTSWIRSQLEPKGIRVSDHKGDGVLLALQGPEAARRLEALAGVSWQACPASAIATCAWLARPKAPPLAPSCSWDAPVTPAKMVSSCCWAKGPAWPSGSNCLEKASCPVAWAPVTPWRLEAAMHLYGSEMDASTTPLEVGLGWLVHLEMAKPFIGREVLERQSAEG
jgi:aminomethyltransferase